MQTRNPSQSEVRSIFLDTYTFYTKWIAVNEPNWDELISDSRVLEHKYQCDLCNKILVELISTIEQSYIERVNIDGK